MNMFGGRGGGRAGQSDVERQQFLAAKVEIESTVDGFNNMVRQCFRKCVPKLLEPELNVAEMTCVDRCVGKYMKCVQKVGTIMQQEQLQQQAAMPAGAAAGGPQ